MKKCVISFFIILLFCHNFSINVLGSSKSDLNYKTGLVILSFEGCYWCNVLKREIKENSDLIQALANTNITYLDKDTSPLDDQLINKAFADNHLSMGYPFVFYYENKTKKFIPIQSYPIKNFKEDLKKRSQKNSFLSFQPFSVQKNTVSKVIWDNYFSKEWDFEKGGWDLEIKKADGKMLLSVLYYSLFFTENKKMANQLLKNYLYSLVYSGINDFVSGGFFRISTYGSYHYPHYEKITNDQIDLFFAFQEINKVIDDQYLNFTINNLKQFLSRDLQLDSGYLVNLMFAYAKDAGDFYLFDPKKIFEMLSENEKDIFKKYFQVGAIQFDRSNKYELGSIIFLKNSDELDMNIFYSLKNKLWEIRRNKLKPATDQRIFYDTQCDFNKKVISNETQLASNTQKALNEIKQILINPNKNLRDRDIVSCALYFNDNKDIIQNRKFKLILKKAVKNSIKNKDYSIYPELLELLSVNNIEVDKTLLEALKNNIKKASWTDLKSHSSLMLASMLLNIKPIKIDLYYRSIDDYQILSKKLSEMIIPLKKIHLKPSQESKLIICSDQLCMAPIRLNESLLQEQISKFILQ